MIKIFGHPGSTCTRKTLCTAHELGLDYELEMVDFMKAEQKGEANLRRQPFGKMPSIEDGDVKLFESRAICRYFADAYGKGKMVPPDAVGRAKMNQWIDVESFYFSSHAMTFIYEHMMGRPQGEEKLAAARTSLDHALGVMDANLAKSDYMAGPAFSIADVAYMPYLEYLKATPAFELVQKHAHVASWWGRVSERPSWMKTAGR